MLNCVTTIYLLNQPQKAHWKRQMHVHTQTYWDGEKCLKEGGGMKIRRKEGCNWLVLARGRKIRSCLPESHWISTEKSELCHARGI